MQVIGKKKNKNLYSSTREKYKLNTEKEQY